VCSLKVLAFEDGSFSPSRKRSHVKTVLVGVLTSNFTITRVEVRDIEVDGLDATEKAIDIAKSLQSFDLILQGSIAYGGFNFIDPEALYHEFRKPVIVVVGEIPDNEAVKNALIKHFDDWKARWSVFNKFSQVFEAHTNPRENPVYVNFVGIDLSQVKDVLKSLTVFGRFPEPLRVAWIIAKSLSKALKTTSKV